MPEFSTDPLEEASGLLLANRHGEARAVLAAYLKTHALSDPAWFLMSHAVSDTGQQIECLERALALNPHNLAAGERLGLLRGGPPTASEVNPDPTPIHYDAPEPPVAPAYSSTLQWPPPDAPEMAEDDFRPAQDSAAQLSGPLTLPGTAPALAAVPPPRRPRDWPMIFLGGVLVLVLVAVGATAAVYVFRPTPTPVAVVVIESTPITFPTLPPTWTATIAVPTSSQTPIPTRTPRPSATFVPVDSTQAAQMDKIAEQVADLRGLAIQGVNPRYLIPRERVAETLEGLVLDPDRRAALENELRVLSVLGLVKPTYDLVKYALNSSSDSLGGFYIPWTKQMFVIGDELTGLERLVYSHEYDHALTDQHFGIAEMGVYPACQLDSQRCAAIRALVEGDATVLMYQWLNQYATPQDFEDFRDYEPPSFTLPEEFPPPYISMELDFPYSWGAAFVEYLYARGRWAEVNKAYAKLPESTEQILHPEKYVAGEAPVPVADPLLADALPAEWLLLEDDVLGQWMTYLILGYGADYEAILPDSTAWDAARGWGGDHYQVYYLPALDQTVLAAHWVWDAPRDNTQFATALRAYMDARLRGVKVPRTDGDCWEANDQAGCVFVSEDNETLWLYAPNQTLINDLLALFPKFQ